jgi:hypothetical protein
LIGADHVSLAFVLIDFATVLGRIGLVRTLSIGGFAGTFDRTRAFFNTCRVRSGPAGIWAYLFDLSLLCGVLSG